MLFNSGEFFFFFILVYLLYLIIPRRPQNLLLLLASYFFYGFWDYRFLALIFISTAVDYTAGLSIEAARRSGSGLKARFWLWASIATNLGILGFFKYFNFFAESLASMAGFFGLQMTPFTLRIILPAGISFYTFQTMSYTIDVYRGQVPATRNLLDFSLFVAFFPQLMAGPIERAKKLIPQLQSKRAVTGEQVGDGTWLIIWGLFKKVFIADNLAPYTSLMFDRGAALTGVDVYLAAVAFSLRFYCDFSGYSDMARGLAKLLGIELRRNFNLPFFARNPADLWGRWHITLSHWFRDYVYGPLSRRTTRRRLRRMAVLPTMLLVGLWHGAGWNFVAWGGLWGLAVIAYILLQPYISRARKLHRGLEPVTAWGGVILTFHIWLLLGLSFWSHSISQAAEMSVMALTEMVPSGYSGKDALTILYFSWPLLVVQAIQLITGKELILKKLPSVLTLLIYFGLILMILVNGAEHEEAFLYFQF